MRIVMSQISTESKQLNCIFENEGNWGEIFGAPQVVLISSIKPISRITSLGLWILFLMIKIKKSYD